MSEADAPTTPVENGALAGLRVLDLSFGHVGYCTKLMAGFGADVIKIESPEVGELLRELGPFWEGEKGTERSIPYLWLNTGKKSVTLDLEKEVDRGALRRLAESADVVVESFKPGFLSDRGLGYDALSRGNAGLVMTSITRFGQSGPYRDYEAEDIQVYALSGLMHETGDPERPPLNSGPALCSYSAALAAYFATLSALYLRERSGRGQHVDVSAQEASLVNIEMSVVNSLQLGLVKKRSADRHVMVPWEMYPCADGDVAIIGGPIRHWRRASEFLDEPKLFESRFDYVKDRMAQREEFERLLRSVVARSSKLELFEEGQKRHLGFAYLVTLDEALDSQQHRERGLFVGIDHPVVGRHRYVGAPFKLSRTPWRDAPSPTLGEHTGEILAEGRVRAAATGGGEQNDRGRLPFEGVRVVDFTHEWAGPIGTRLLADLGAEVIRIEYPRRLCVVRGARTDDRHYNKHPMWHQVNRNKLSVTMDLKNPDHVEAFKDLVKVSDVVVNNCRAGVMEALGLGYEELRTLRPELVFASLSGFGSTGPYTGYAGFGGTIEPLTGLLQLTAYERGGKPFRIREMDVVNGLAGATAVVTALFHKMRTGEGQFVDLSQAETATHALMGEALLELVMNGDQTLPIGNRSPYYAPQGCYPAKGEDHWIAITVRSDEEWRQLCDAAGHPEWASDPRFTTRHARFEHHDACDELIGRWTSTRDRRELMHELQEVGIASGAVLDGPGLASDPHLRDRGYFMRAEAQANGLFPGMLFKSSVGGGRFRHRGPDLGEHNAYVFGELLGRSEDHIPKIVDEEVGTSYDPE